MSGSYLDSIVSSDVFGSESDGSNDSDVTKELDVTRAMKNQDREKKEFKHDVVEAVSKGFSSKKELAGYLDYSKSDIEKCLQELVEEKVLYTD